MTSTNTLLTDSSLADSPKKSSLVAALAPDVARRKFVLNVASNMTYTALTTIVMLWYTPYLIQHLGVAAYGLIPLAFSIITYLSIGTESLHIAISRFLAIDLNRLDEMVANRTFNTAFFISVAFVVVLLPLTLVFAWLFPVLFRVPVGLENEARLLFVCVATEFLLTVLGSNFGVSSLILHRFDLRNLVKILSFGARIGLVVVLFTILPAQLWHVGAGFVLAAILAFGGDWLFWRRLTPQLHIKPSAFDRSRLGQLLGMSGWSIVNAIGNLLFLGVDLIIVNLFFGAEMTGLYGTLLLFPKMVTSLVAAISSIISPVIVARYAVHDFEGLRHLASRAVKLMGIGLALPVGLLVGFAGPLLDNWLGPDFKHLDYLLIILVGHLSVNLATRPLSEVLTSYNKVRVQGIVTLILGIVNVGLSIALAHWGGWGAAGVAIATAIVWTTRQLIFLSGYSAHIMGQRWWTYYLKLIVGAVGTLAVGLSGYGLTQIWWPENWFVLGGMAAIVSLAYGVVAYFLGLNHEDRQLLWDLLPLQTIINAKR